MIMAEKSEQENALQDLMGGVWEMPKNLHWSEKTLVAKPI